MFWCKSEYNEHNHHTSRIESDWQPRTGKCGRIIYRENNKNSYNSIFVSEFFEKDLNLFQKIVCKATTFLKNKYIEK